MNNNNELNKRIDEIIKNIKIDTKEFGIENYKIERRYVDSENVHVYITCSFNIYNPRVYLRAAFFESLGFTFKICTKDEKPFHSKNPLDQVYTYKVEIDMKTFTELVYEKN